MIVCLNGQFVPEEQAVVSAFDRGWLYGDGLFETARVHRGQPFQWTAHIARLQQGMRFLRLSLPCAPETLRHWADELIRLNQLPDAVLRLQITRGRGPRGYATNGCDRPQSVMALYPAPDPLPLHAGWRLIFATHRLYSGDPLLRLKTCNRLFHVLARAEAERLGADDALLLNEQNQVVEATGANLFWIQHGLVCTPPLSAGALPGTTRELVLALCSSDGLTPQEETVTREELQKADGIFLTMSTRGIVPVQAIENTPVTSSPIMDRLRQAYRQRLLRQTGS